MSGCIEKEMPTGDIIQTPKIVSENSDRPEVYFCPKDECQEHLLEEIKKSEDYVYCAFFDLDLKDIIKELKNKDVDVKLVVDKTNADEVKSLNPIKNDDTYQLMHNKFCVIDGKIVITGSLNPTERGNFYNNNNMLIFSSKYLAKNYESEFEELWNEEFSFGEDVEYPIIYLNNKRIENYFCPEDFCSEHVIDVLNQAENSIYFMTFTFTSDEIGDIILEKNNEGLDIKGIFEKTRLSKYSEYEKFEENGIEVRMDKNKYVMHHKVFIIDEKIVITGSFNPTASANEKNDENILILYDEKIAKKYLDEFDCIWNFEEKIDFEEKTADTILLSEIYYDTSGKDYKEEFVEIYNPTNNKIDLNYFFISNNKTYQRLNGILEVNSTKILKPKFALNNRGGILILKKNFEQIDFVSWESLWKIEAKKGFSLQREFFNKTNSENQWFVDEPSKNSV